MTGKIATIWAAALLVTAGAAWLVVSGSSSSEEAPFGDSPGETRTAVDPTIGSPHLQGLSPSPEKNAEAIAKLEQSIARLERALVRAGGGGALDPERHKTQVVGRLKAIEYGEQQTAMKESVKDLAAIGDPVVPDLVRLLKTGFKRDWGGGFSTGGNAVKSYGRMRMVLIDALRQVGSEKAKEGLLDAIGESKDLDDYRDLLLLYGATKDPQMVDGISTLIPGLLRLVAKDGVSQVAEDSSMLTTLIVRWIRIHGMSHLTEDIATLVGKSPLNDHHVREFFSLLVEFDPERAVAVAKRAHGRSPQAVRGPVLLGFASRGDVPLAQIARFVELLLAEFDLTDSQQRSLHTSIRPVLCRRIKDPKDRAKDGRVLLTLLERRRDAESDPNMRSFMDRTIASFRTNIEKIEAK